MCEIFMKHDFTGSLYQFFLPLIDSRPLSPLVGVPYTSESSNSEPSSIFVPVNSVRVLFLNVYLMRKR